MIILKETWIWDTFHCYFSNIVKVGQAMAKILYKLLNFPSMFLKIKKNTYLLCCVLLLKYFFLLFTWKLLNSKIWFTCFIHVSSIKERSQKYFMCGKYYNCIFVFDNFSTMQIIWPQSNSSTHLSFSSHTLPKVRFVGCSGIWKTPPPLLKMDLLTYSTHSVPWNP